MADNIANILPPPSSIRLCVEPVQVELEHSDGSLLFSALQSAFPQSTGIYFRPKGAECRAMLKFDGRRFLAPNGGWNSGVEYFVELAGNRQTPFPFGSYEHASKQFERSVNLVQQMMNGTSMQMKGNNNKTRMGSGGGQRRISTTAANDGKIGPIPPMEQQQNGAGIRHQFQQQQNNEFGELNNGRMVGEEGEGNEQNHQEQQQQQGERKLSTPHRKSSIGGFSDLTLMSSSARDAKSMERDFADLARICAGKDAVIDGQRLELDAMKKDLDRLKAIEGEWAEKEAEWRAKWEAAERELEMLRALGKDQQGLHGQIVELGRELETERATWERARGELEMEMRKWEREAQEWKDKSELGTWTINELTEQLKRTQREKADLLKKAAILEEQVNGEAMEFSRRFQERERIQQELLADNTRLYQIKDQLEQQSRELKEKLAKLQGEYGQKMEAKMKELKAESETKEQKLRDNLAIADSRGAQLEAKVTELCSQKEEAEKQIRTLKNHSELGNSEPLFAYSQG